MYFIVAITWQLYSLVIDPPVIHELGLVMELVGRIRMKSSEIPSSLAATCAVCLFQKDNRNSINYLNTYLSVNSLTNFNSAMSDGNCTINSINADHYCVRTTSIPHHTPL